MTLMNITFFIPDFRGGGAQKMIVNMAGEIARRGHHTTLLVVQKTGPYLESRAGRCADR